MATITNKAIIDIIIANEGYSEDDPQVVLIVEYDNAYGNTTWGVTWENELPDRQLRYLVETNYVRNPRIIWRRNEDIIKTTKE